MHPDDAPPRQDTGRAAPVLVATLESCPAAVRRTLAELRLRLAALCLDGDASGSVELVLAEVMNNICEHAYRGTPRGRIELSIWADGDALVFETRDEGVPMPGGQVPRGRPLPLDGPLSEMPEGGFGWHLIHELATDLAYARVGDSNRLSFRIRRAARAADA